MQIICVRIATPSLRVRKYFKIKSTDASVWVISSYIKTKNSLYLIKLANLSYKTVSSTRLHFN